MSTIHNTPDPETYVTIPCDDPGSTPPIHFLIAPVASLDMIGDLYGCIPVQNIGPSVLEHVDEWMEHAYDAGHFATKLVVKTSGHAQELAGESVHPVQLPRALLSDNAISPSCKVPNVQH